MIKSTKAAVIIILALLLPACGPKPPSGGVLGGPGLNPDKITVSVQNNDATAYNLAIREFTNGVLSAEVRIAWPIVGASGGIPSHAEGTWIFHPDSPTYTHSVILYDLAGTVLDEQPFVKGAGQLLVVATISAGKMTVSP